MENELTIDREEIKSSRKSKTNARNSMGCSENWYDSYYAIANTFTDEEIDNFTDKELDNLLKLACKIQEALY